MCCILKDTEDASEELGWCRDVCDNVIYIIIITPQPLLAGAGPGPAVTSLLYMFRGGRDLTIKYC